jgi:hypothetical protein
MVRDQEFAVRQAAVRRRLQDVANSLKLGAVTESFLRQDVTLVNGQSTYNFNFSEVTAGGTPLPQKLLAQTDLFVCTSLGYGLLRSVTGEEGTAIFQTYVNDTLFPAAAGFTPGDLRVFWNGSIVISVGQTKLWNGLDTFRFWYVPQTQESATIDFSQNEDNGGFIPMMPIWKLFGQSNNLLTVNIAAFATMEVASVVAGTLNKLTVIPRGFIVPNGGTVGYIDKFADLELDF